MTPASGTTTTTTTESESKGKRGNNGVNAVNGEPSKKRIKVESVLESLPPPTTKSTTSSPSANNKVCDEEEDDDKSEATSTTPKRWKGMALTRICRSSIVCAPRQLILTLVVISHPFRPLSLSFQLLAHCMVEDYVDTVGRLMFPASTNYTFNAVFPLERVTALGYLESNIRRRHIWEDWSPREIALFEAALTLYGKDFSRIARLHLPNKCTKDVVAFYYVWKKTKHYQEWKRQYIPDEGAWVMDEVKPKRKNNESNSSDRK